MRINKKKYTIFDAITIPFQCDWKVALVIVILAVGIGVIPTIQTVVLAECIDLSLGIIDNKINFIEVLPWILCLIVLIAFLWTATVITKYLQERLTNSLREDFRTAIVKKRTSLKYQCIEDSKTWDLIMRISDKAEDRLAQEYVNLFNFFALLLRIAGLILLLFVNVWWVALVVVCFSIPTTIFSIQSGKQTYNVRQQTQHYHRFYEYLGDILSNRDAAEERNVFGIGEKLARLWHCYYEKARKIENKVKLKWYIKMKFGGIAMSFIFILIIFVLLHPVLSGSITVGIFVSLVNSTFLLVDTMSWTLTEYTEQIANNIEYMKDLTEFSMLPEENLLNYECDKEIEFQSLEFKNVRFKYPQTDVYILDGVSFRLEKDKRYAIVGINGAGKTTITKLLTGLYSEYEGSIYLNEVDIKMYTQKELSRIFSSVYQDFAQYYISIKDNVKLGNINKIKEFDDKEVYETLSKVGLDDLMNSLPEKIETKLGKIYSDGKDLSGGEWQRLALARTLYSSAAVFILDEPTAALDPVSEMRIYQEFDEMSKGKTTILISHRLSSTQFVDSVIVLNKGKVEEQGSHETLMKKKKLYFTMYESQKKWYE